MILKCYYYVPTVPFKFIQTSDYDTYAIRTNSANPKKMERYLYTRHLYSMLGGFSCYLSRIDIRFHGGMRLRQMNMYQNINSVIPRSVLHISHSIIELLWMFAHSELQFSMYFFLEPSCSVPPPPLRFSEN